MPDPLSCVLKVALPLPLPRCFDYLLPSPPPLVESLVGCRVRVPFGNGEKIGIVESAQMQGIPETELKTVLEVLDQEPVFSGELLQNLRWLSRYTHAPIGEVYATAMPSLLRQGRELPDNKIIAWELTPLGRHQWTYLRANTKLRKFAERLLKHPVTEDQLDLDTENWRATASNLKRRGLVERVALKLETHPVKKQAATAAQCRTKKGAARDRETGGGFSLPFARRRDRQRQDRSIFAGNCTLSFARKAGADSGAGNRIDTADAETFPRASWCSRLQHAFRLERWRTCACLVGDVAGAGACAGRNPLCGIRTDAEPRFDHRR